MIVDYANVFASLEKALAIYGKGAGGAMPVRDKKALADELRYAVNDANVFVWNTVLCWRKSKICRRPILRKPVRSVPPPIA